MKKMIHEVQEQSGNNYQLWAEFTDCTLPLDYKTLRFYSMYSGAKDPGVPWNKGEFFLPPEAVQSLKELLEEV